MKVPEKQIIVLKIEILFEQFEQLAYVTFEYPQISRLQAKLFFHAQVANNGTMLRQAHAAAGCGGGYAQRRDNYGRTDLLFLCIFPILFRDYS